ncbi:TPA: type I-A CRISPR-associated protein Cas5, partial [Candidatus Bathyarchaeota archaeon]|nr:type I-A CRISPR-associated protein Cas5 [Candidatus Bathyarchaeota archaeon]
MEIFSVKIFLPLFYVRYREAWGVRLSSRLPPPRTILGALAKGLGIILGIEGGETLINGEPARKILTEAVESSSYGF